MYLPTKRGLVLAAKGTSMQRLPWAGTGNKALKCDALSTSMVSWARRR